jgi:hypothetical protein
VTANSNGWVAISSILTPAAWVSAFKPATRGQRVRVGIRKPGLLTPRWCSHLSLVIC